MSSLLEWAMSELCKNPHTMQKSKQELHQVLNNKHKIQEKDLLNLHYLKLVIKETLRLHPPVPLLLPRLCREPCDINGFHIPEGTRVAVNVWAMGRDKGIWGYDAESFRPERFEESSVDFGGGSFEFLPFGAGRRMCPAIGFGLATAEIALAHLVHCFDWKLVDGEELDMREAIRPTLRREKELVLVASVSESAAGWLN